jgi:predicted TPR repeat methyltransferase
MNLRRKSTLILLEDQGSHFAFDSLTNDLQRLNEIPVMVLAAADGTRTADEIIKEILPSIGLKNAEKARRWIEKAIDSGTLVENATDEPPPVHSATDLDELAARLKSADKVRLAYLVQKKAAMLAPDEPMIAYRLAELAHIMGLRNEARTAYEFYFRHFPGDHETALILSALRDEPPPERAPDDFLTFVYRRFSGFYEETMCDDLKYHAPEHLLAAIRKASGSCKDLVSLDLGCGTGLFGMKLRPCCRRLVGVDISPEMLKIAESRQVYDSLAEAEINRWLDQTPVEQYDLITLCDTLIYFGNLEPVLKRSLPHLKPSGLLAFTLEKGEISPFRLSDSGRFQHHKNHVRDTAKSVGLEVVERSEKVLRLEYGTEVVGLVTVLRKKGE